MIFILQPVDVCDFGEAISALDDRDSLNDLSRPIPGTILLDVGGNFGSPRDPRGADISASVAIQVDDFSLMMVAYGDTNSNFVGIVSTRGISKDWTSHQLVFIFLSRLIAN